MDTRLWAFFLPLFRLGLSLHYSHEWTSDSHCRWRRTWQLLATVLGGRLRPDRVPSDVSNGPLSSSAQAEPGIGQAPSPPPRSSKKLELALTLYELARRLLVQRNTIGNATLVTVPITSKSPIIGPSTIVFDSWTYESSKATSRMNPAI
jgi:hypothetical protein